MEQTETIIIATGGTGGHLYPGIALARELKKRNFRPVFVVRNNDLCCKILEGESFEYFQIPMIGLSRSFSLKIFKFIFILFISYFKALKIIGSQKPKAVVGMGGYISAPTVLAAKTKGIKVILHESNCLPGLANKFLKIFADKVALGFEESKKYFPEAVFTGNPVRLEVFKKLDYDVYGKYKLSKDNFTIFIFGGSQGAKNLNRIVIDSLIFMPEYKEKIQFVHLTGQSDVEWVKNGYKKSGFSAAVLSYLETIGEAYYMADLIVCRSGSSTVSEIEILNKPAILIPFPYATENHQEYNAKALVNKLKAVMLKEKDLRPDVLAAAITFQLKSFRGHRSRVELPSPLPQEKLADLVLV